MSIPNVNIKDFTAVIEKTIDLKTIEGINIPTVVWGNHGIGKTSIIKQIAKKRGMKTTILNGALMSPEDILGVPKQDGSGGYHLPDFLPKQDDEPVVLFIDELNRSPKFLLQSLFGLILNGEIHNKQVIRDCDIVVAACNPPSDKYEVTEFDDEAFLSRFAHYILTPEKAEYSSYLSKAVKNSVIQNVLSESKFFNDNIVTLDYKGSHDNRNLERCALLIEKLDRPFIEKHGMQMFNSLVGYDVGSIIMNEYRNTSSVSYHEIATEKVKLTKVDKNNIAIVNGIINTVETHFNEIADKKVSKKEVKMLDKFIKYIPRDLAVQVLSMIFKNENSVEYARAVLDLDIDYYEPLINEKE